MTEAEFHALNQERIDLIHRKYRRPRLTQEEKTRLDELQRIVTQYLNVVAPLPTVPTLEEVQDK